MTDDSFFVAGLGLNNILMANRFGSEVPLKIRVVSGRVARGGMAHILKGEIQSPDLSADLPPLVALKVILIDPGSVERERIRRELAAVEVARHRHILPFVGTTTISGCTVLVSGFMKNGTMLEYIRANPTTRKEPLIHQISDAVNHLHSVLKLVHGDLKCQNVLISDGGDALLADFGLATTTGESVVEDATITAIRTTNTLRFAAPELLSDTAKSPLGNKKSKTPRSDVYAFGMLMIQAFTEASPWPGLNDQDVRSKLFRKKRHPRPNKSVEMGLTDPWWSLCRTCWKSKPEERPTMAEIHSQIATILDREAADKGSESSEVPDFGPQTFNFSRALLQVNFLNFDQVTPTYAHIGEGNSGYREANAWLLDAIRGPQKALEQLPAAKRDWISVVNAFQLCPLFIQAPAAAINRKDDYTMERRNLSKRNAVYKSVGDELRMWLHKFWDDLDVEQGSGSADIKAIHNIVAHAGTLLDGDNTIKRDRHTKTVVDIGVLRYPDISCPYIKVYRIELVAWYDSTTVGAYTLDRNGLIAKFNLQQYEPEQHRIEGMRVTWRRDALDNLAQNATQKAMPNAETDSGGRATS